MTDRETMTLEQLEEWLHHHDSIKAGDELVRRLREVDTRLAGIRSDADMRPECRQIRRLCDEALAIIKGDAGKCASCIGRGLWGGDMTCPRCGGTGDASGKETE